MSDKPLSQLSARFDNALLFASDLHRKQFRKETGIPYITHLLAVSSLVLEHGGSESQAIAALLHDAIECQAQAFGGAEKLRTYIKWNFGDLVLHIINGCTDVETEPKPPWRARKEIYLTHIKTVDAVTALVACCDKLQNARTIVSDLRNIGLAAFDRSEASKEEMLWYYRSLALAFKERQMPVAFELGRVVAEMERLSKSEESSLNDLPASFPAGTKFFDIRGIPVAVLRRSAIAYEPPAPRQYSYTLAMDVGSPITEDQFRKIVASHAEEVRQKKSG